MPLLRVSMYTGRTKEQKAELAKELTDVMVRVAKTKPESVEVIFEDVERSDWAHAGILASDK